MTARAAAIVEVLRSALAPIDSLDPEEQDAIVSALVADLRARRRPVRRAARPIAARRRTTRPAATTPEQILARVDAAIERTRAALDELTAIRAAVVGEQPADGISPARLAELRELAARRAAMLRRSAP